MGVPARLLGAGARAPRLVWAHVVIEEDEYRVVLDARDGREPPRLPLDSAAAGSHHLSHPDGIHRGLSIGMGQDGVLLHWARWDGAEPTARDLGGTTGRILVDVHPGHAGFLTVQHYGADLELHAADGSVVAQGAPEGDGSRWDYWCGFVDADTVIAVAEDGTHLLPDARTLEVRGAVARPAGPVEGGVRPLGDGTRLTYDTASGTLNRWTHAGA
ncbi:hypothetical protein AB0953_30485 [Streptomyces sp. NPDC046866]|uniref:hypothetical protein n=1 Tax=Streptomyces sp. NPDC046866 TaxID=3154921 RepID=UPI003453784D